MTARFGGSLGAAAAKLFGLLSTTRYTVAFTANSVGLIIANATTLALGQARQATGTGSAVLGALQFLLAAAISPLVGIGGEHTAVPMALAMVISAFVALAALTPTRTRSWSLREQPTGGGLPRP